MVLNKKKRGLFLILLLLSSLSSLFSLAVPALEGRVNDYAKIINSNTEAEITSYLESLDEQTGVQIVVLTVPSLEGEDLASYSIKVAENWGIGHQGKDNGALLLVAYEERSLRIETGYGLEGSLTDAKCGLIIRNVIIPEFRNGDYSEGILKGVKNMGGIASGNVELVNKSVLEEEDEDGAFYGILFLLIWIIFCVAIVYAKNGILKWLFLSHIFGSGSKSGKSYRKSSGSGFSGFSGGGFGGGFSGGGGHFGGGGASGHW